MDKKLVYFLIAVVSIAFATVAVTIGVRLSMSNRRAVTSAGKKSAVNHFYRSSGASETVR